MSVYCKGDRVVATEGCLHYYAKGETGTYQNNGWVAWDNTLGGTTGDGIWHASDNALLPLVEADESAFKVGDSVIALVSEDRYFSAGDLGKVVEEANCCDHVLVEFHTQRKAVCGDRQWYVSTHQLALNQDEAA